MLALQAATSQDFTVKKIFDRSRGVVREALRVPGIFPAPRFAKPRRLVGDLSERQRAQLVHFCTKHVAISSMVAGEIDVDWFSRKGLKPRWKARLVTRLAREAASRAASSFMAPK